MSEQHEALGTEEEALRAEVAALRESRARILADADGSRRALERKLHGGAQQRLVSLSLTLKMARGKLESDPERAAELLDSVEQEIAAALEDLRELARDIHPAVLSDRGLHAALEGLTRRAPIPVELHAPEARFPARLEAAAYFVVAEALENVVKYASASKAAIEVTSLGGSTVVEVRDDGVGGADLREGGGLRALSDRVAALDGRLELVSPPGAGTIIRVEFPCA